MSEAALELRGLEKRFGAQTAVAAIDLQVQQGEFVTLLGPSGCGKTTTLNMIAGFITPDAGSIRLGGRAVENLPPHRRDLGIVFQDYALFPHRNAAENVAFGLRMRKLAKTEIAARVADALRMVRLDGLDKRRPLQLSGGQRQRVALARALVIRPALLLLDEPLSNLDLKLREEMRSEISTLQRRLGIATVFVTHDQDEALTMSDRIAVMRQGRIEQIGTARDIYERPASVFVATFIGSTNLVRAKPAGPPSEGLVPLATAAGPAILRLDRPLAAGADLLLAIRPERLQLTPTGTAPDGSTAWPVRIEGVTYLGGRLEIALRLADGSPATAHAMNLGAMAWQPGHVADAWFRPDDAWPILDGGASDGAAP
ncbi:MAG: ABC transporter ATP-binding protein [Acidisphaera sp.]|nr:ABC transporter ATP-binding protein [Acidisphaera sp.]